MASAGGTVLRHGCAGVRLRPAPAAFATASPPNRSARRSFGRYAPRSRQRLYWSGTVLDQTADELRAVPLDWLEAVGVGKDARQGITFTRLTSSISHSMFAYRTLVPEEFGRGRADRGEAEEEEDQRGPPTPGSDLPFSRHIVAGQHKLVAVGRNTFGELGLGFTSQEATWGMVSSGFEGEGGLERVACGSGFTWLLTLDDKREPTRVYACGNGSLGQTGQTAGVTGSALLSASGEAQLSLASKPTRVELPEGAHVLDVACGIDHVLLLVRSVGPEGAGAGSPRLDVLGCGLNTDTQLTTRLDSPVQAGAHSLARGLPPEVLDPDSPHAIRAVAAGGDTSFAVTRSGRVFGWGNNEYAQIGGRSDVDEERLTEPTEITQWIRHSIGEDASVRQLCCGGSWLSILDDRGRVWTAGYGPLGIGTPSEVRDGQSPATDDGTGARSRAVHLPIVTSLQQVYLPVAIDRLAVGLDHIAAWSRARSGVDGIAAEDGTSARTGDGAGNAGRRSSVRSATPSRLFTWGIDSDAGRGSRLAMGVARASGEGARGGNGTVAGRERRVFEPREVRVPVANAAVAAAGASEIVEVALGSDAMWVLVEDGEAEVGRWTGPAQLATW